MVDRGDCTFVSKVRNAQAAGASGVLIADSVCQCDFVPNQCTNPPGVQCEGFEPIMADDGSGSDITIPSFLLFKQDADVIKQRLQQNSIVQVKMAWSIPAPDDRVEWELWSSPTEMTSRNFQSGFKSEIVALGKSQYFTPHFYIYDGISSQCHGGSSSCGSLCTNHGLYCALDPDGNLDEGTSGADVVVESLRRLCIWQHYGAEDGIGTKYWDYMTTFLDTCDEGSGHFPTITDSSCADSAMKKHKIDSKMVDQCMQDSGGYTLDQTNTKLAGEIQYKDQLGVIIVPSVYVNNVVQRGAVTSNSVFNMICSGFLDGTQPEICQECMYTNDMHKCVNGGGSGNDSNGGGSGGGVSSGGLVVALIFVIAGLLGAGFYYYKKTQREMRDQVRGILAEYMPLDDGAIGGGGGRGSEGGMAMTSKGIGMNMP
jgi:hypothetical protein